MVLSEYALTHPGFRFRILATDISTTVLAKAELGVYTGDVVRPVPAALRRKYFMRSRDARLRARCVSCRSCAACRVSPPELHGCRLRHLRKRPMRSSAAT
jgi:hypothetical protein